MKLCALSVVFCLLACVCSAKGAQEAPAAAAISPEEIIARLEGLFDEDEDGEVVVSPERFTAILKGKIARLDGLATDFRKRFPGHPLRWKLIVIEALNLPVRKEAGLPLPKGQSARGMFEQVLAAPDAPREVKSEAGVQRLMLTAEDIGGKKLTVEEWEKWLEQHWKDFPDAGDNAVLEELHTGIVQEFAPARLDALLAKLAAHPDSAIADMAKGRQAGIKALAEIKSKPLELQFKALDGTDVDFAKMRGKVVLVDFWATWCGPCMAEIPKVVAAYEKLHEKGFEVVGISLDEDEAALKRVVKSKRMKWPQYFDGRGWESELARRFHIDAIPAMWLINKEGMIVDTDAAGNIEEKVEKLLEAK